MPDPVTRLRRLTEIAEIIRTLDPKDDDFEHQFSALKNRAEIALAGRKVGRGNYINLDQARQKAAEQHKARGDDTARRVQPIIKRLRKAGYSSLTDIAKALDDMGIEPPKAKFWTRRSVLRIEQRTLLDDT